jgi:hypothetical protein
MVTHSGLRLFYTESASLQPTLPKQSTSGRLAVAEPRSRSRTNSRCRGLDSARNVYIPEPSPVGLGRPDRGENHETPRFSHFLFPYLLLRRTRPPVADRATAPDAKMARRAPPLRRPSKSWAPSLGHQCTQVPVDRGNRRRPLLHRVWPPTSPSLPNHVHRFNSLQCPPRRRERAVALRQPGLGAGAI